VQTGFQLISSDICLDEAIRPDGMDKLTSTFHILTCNKKIGIFCLTMTNPDAQHDVEICKGLSSFGYAFMILWRFI
jgi:hypothetical protein